MQISWQKLFGWFKYIKKNNVEDGIIVYGESLGEVKILFEMANVYYNYKNSKFIFFTDTITGWKYLQNKSKKLNSVCLIKPADFSWFNKYLILKIKPKLIIISESLYPPNLLLFAKKKNIKIISVNSRLSLNTYKLFLILKPFFINQITNIDKFIISDIESKNLLIKFGVTPDKFRQISSFKFSKIVLNDQNQENILLAEEMIKNVKFMFVAGSVQPTEIYTIVNGWLKAFNKIKSGKLIIIPRHPENIGNFIKRLSNINIKVLKKVKYNYIFENEIHILAKIGILPFWYQISNGVFVGGTLEKKRGGQNFIEPIQLQKPTAIGQYVKKFSVEKKITTKLNAITIINDGLQLANFIEKCYVNDEVLIKNTLKGYRFIHNNLTNYKKIVQFILE